MRSGWWIAGVLLAVSFLTLPGSRAVAQNSNPAPSPRDVVKQLRDDLTDTQKKLDDLTKALNGAKGGTDAKKLREDLTAAQTRLKALEAEVKAKTAEVAKEMEAVKAAKGITKDELNEVKSLAEAAKTAGTDAAGTATTTGKERGDTAWILTASAFVLFMVPGLALFYGGMVRRKNVLATMMQSMIALAIVGVYWIAIGYSLAFGPSVYKADLFGVEKGGIFGWSWDLVFLKGIKADDKLPAYDISVYLHVMFQGMFAIITPALISGAIAERIRFWPFCIFMILWVTFVYCPLAHMVWAFDWFDPSVLAAKRGASAIGLLGKMGALDFAGGTVVHIAAGMAGLACCLVLRKRHGYPEQVAHPNSMVLTLLGAGMLWFGWFGFNGGSALNSTTLAVSAFAATQAAAAAAGLGWVVAEWIHKGKPTALGLASGIVAGLVAVTPASGFVYMWGGVAIGLAAAVVCYIAVNLKGLLGYDDSLDAFGVHGVGGFVGAVLTGVFASSMVNSAGGDGPFSFKYHESRYKELEPIKKDGKEEDSKPISEAKAELKKAEDAVAEKSKELKVEELAAAVAEAEKKLADLPKDAKSEDKEKAEKDLEEAKKKAAAADKELEEPKAVAADKKTTVDNLTKELATLTAIVNKHNDTDHDGKDKKTAMTQVGIQLKAAVFSVVFAFVLSIALAALTQAITLGNFTTTENEEAVGLDRTEHGEVGFDFSAATESVSVIGATPRAAAAPPSNGRYDLQVAGVEADDLVKAWNGLCQPTEKPDADFVAIYPYFTTLKGTRFRFRGGEPETLSRRLESLLTKQVGGKIRVTKVG